MIWKAIMEKLEKLYEGKAKQLYATDDPEVLWVEYKNTATAGDGEKKEDFTGKGRLNNLITTIIFDLLKKRGIDSHLIKRVNATGQLVRKVNMFPLEIVQIIVLQEVLKYRLLERQAFLHAQAGAEE